MQRGGNVFSHFPTKRWIMIDPSSLGQEEVSALKFILGFIKGSLGEKLPSYEVLKMQ